MAQSADAGHSPETGMHGPAGIVSRRARVLPVLRRSLIFPLMPLFFVGQYAGEARRPVLGSDTRIEVKPIALDASDPTRKRIGPLFFVEGWEIAGVDDAFGSFSAMSAAHGKLTLLNDAGGVIRLSVDDAGRIGNVGFADLPGGPGQGWAKYDRDSESMARDPVTGQVWIGFERANEIWRYSADLRRAEASARPAAMRDWPNNGGAEAMVRLRSGRFLVFSETARAKQGGFEALAFDRDPTDPAARVTRFSYRPPRAYRVTDAVELADGRLLLLHRRIALSPYLSAKLTVLDPAAIRAGVRLEGRELAEFVPPLTVDNMEALALDEEDGRPILWMASDDNFRAFFQRNLLFKFALMPVAE